MNELVTQPSKFEMRKVKRREYLLYRKTERKEKKEMGVIGKDLELTEMLK